MIAYMCKYAPVEILEAFGTPAVIMEPRVTNFTQADTLMHPNMCSYVKAVLEEFETSPYEGMIFTTCCDSCRRLFDTLKHRYPEKFFFCLALPRKMDEKAVLLYAKQMEQLIEEYAAFSGRTFDADRFLSLCGSERKMQRGKPQEDGTDSGEKKENDLKICLAGARPGSEIKQLIEDLGADIVLDLTCTGVPRDYVVNPDHLLTSYAKSLLKQIPCMRMHGIDGRVSALSDREEPIDGIIYHTVKFCDIYSYEYTEWKEEGRFPMVKLETDATTQCAGQIRTRVEAFLESLRTRKEKNAGSSCPGCCGDGVAQKADRLTMEDIREDSTVMATAAETEKVKNTMQAKTNGPLYVAGIDSGSTSTNAVILNEKKEILAFSVLRTGAKSSESAERILQDVLTQAGLCRADLSLIVSTGYGRVSIPFADKNVTEISCHGKGAHFINPAVRTILDVGGQDSKAIRLNADGDVVDFVMNDKCAAGTGRFLEMMARTLEISIDELGPLSLKSKENVEISSMCSVFAESEVISLIAQNKETADIAHGIHRAISGKVVSLLKRVGIEEEIMMTGGVAKNPGVVKALEEILGMSLCIYEEPEIVGAIGAALYGMEGL